MKNNPNLRMHPDAMNMQFASLNPNLRINIFEYYLEHSDTIRMVFGLYAHDNEA